MTAPANIRAVLGDFAPIMIAVSADLSQLSAIREEYDFAFAKPIDLALLMAALQG